MHSALSSSLENMQHSMCLWPGAWSRKWGVCHYWCLTLQRENITTLLTTLLTNTRHMWRDKVTSLKVVFVYPWAYKSWDKESINQLKSLCTSQTYIIFAVFVYVSKVNIFGFWLLVGKKQFAKTYFWGAAESVDTKLMYYHHIKLIWLTC